MQLRHYILTRRQQPENEHGAFTREILVAEGLPGFELRDLDADGLPDLQPSDTVILTRCFPRVAEIDRLAAALEQGTRVVCFQPSPRFAERFGWVTTKSVLVPGWIRIRAGQPGAGLPVQTHLPVALYQPAEEHTQWRAAAYAVHPDWSDAGAPAIILQTVGRGQLVFWFYDLPGAVARLRFGNPELTGYLTTGLWRWPHACDLFGGQVDERVKHLPQADFHGQLLARILTEISPAPLARLWYYPQPEHRSVAIVQSDDDWSTPEQFQEISDCLRARQGAATFYLVHDTKLSPAMVEDLRAAGHTFAPHANPHRSQDEWCFDFPRVLAEETADFKRRFGSCSATIQCHCAPWHGYLEWVPMFRAAGYRLLFAYLAGPPVYWHTYMCGSGRPVRFYDRRGQLHDCWQQPVVVYDDQSLIPLIRDEPGELIDRFERFLADVVDRTYTAVPFLSHPVSFATYSRPFMEPCWDRVRAAGIPIWNGDQWLDFTDRRAAVNISTETESDGTVRYEIGPVAGELTAMVPGTKREGLTVGGRPAAGGVVHRRLEEDYTFLPLRGDGEKITVQKPAG